MVLLRSQQLSSTVVVVPLFVFAMLAPCGEGNFHCYNAVRFREGIKPVDNMVKVLEERKIPINGNKTRECDNHVPSCQTYRCKENENGTDLFIINSCFDPEDPCNMYDFNTLCSQVAKQHKEDNFGWPNCKECTGEKCNDQLAIKIVTPPKTKGTTNAGTKKRSSGQPVKPKTGTIAPYVPSPVFINYLHCLVKKNCDLMNEKTSTAKSSRRFAICPKKKCKKRAKNCGGIIRELEKTAKLKKTANRMRKINNEYIKNVKENGQMFLEDYIFRFKNQTTISM